MIEMFRLKNKADGGSIYSMIIQTSVEQILLHVIHYLFNNFYNIKYNKNPYPVLIHLNEYIFFHTYCNLTLTTPTFLFFQLELNLSSTLSRFKMKKNNIKLFAFLVRWVKTYQLFLYHLLRLHQSNTWKQRKISYFILLYFYTFISHWLTL